MGYYALFYREVVPDFIERRGGYRDAHLGLAREAHARGELILAGALAEPPDGALLVFRGDNPASAEDFVSKDPYVLNGLVKRWEIRRWTVVVGNQ
ncbi:MAG: YciI-like protein [Candidatus Acidiferrum sp.]